MVEYSTVEFNSIYTCVDDDECARASTKCHHFADCTNNDGSYKCDCKDGYKGDGQVDCRIIDACSEMDRCGPNGKCFNVIGTGHQCICDRGYRDASGDTVLGAGGVAVPSGTGLGPCVNINECLERAAYTADGASISAYCGENTVCSDTDGSWNCACKTGYEGDPYVNCRDINECKNNNYVDSCSPDGACINTPGSYGCICKEGFHGNGITCRDNNECKLGTDECVENAICINTKVR